MHGQLGGKIKERDVDEALMTILAHIAPDDAFRWVSPKSVDTMSKS